MLPHLVKDFPAADYVRQSGHCTKQSIRFWAAANPIECSSDFLGRWTNLPATFLNVVCCVFCAVFVGAVRGMWRDGGVLWWCGGVVVVILTLGSRQQRHLQRCHHHLLPDANQ